MNPNLSLLQPYPFQKLAELLRDVPPNPAFSAINLSIGEPKHATPEFIKNAITNHLAGLANYPTTLGTDGLRIAIAEWLKKRHGPAELDYRTQVLPVNGSREALFAFAQTVIDASRPDPVVVCPNPFYQIYEGAALLAGARKVVREFDWEVKADRMLALYQEVSSAKALDEAPLSPNA